jgi:hypothetical protein
LLALGAVDAELAEVFAGGGVDDADVQVLDEQDDAGSGGGSPMPMEWSRLGTYLDIADLLDLWAVALPAGRL